MPNTVVVKAEEIHYPRMENGCNAPLLDVDHLLKGIEEASQEAFKKGDRVSAEISLMDKMIDQIATDRKKGSIEVAELKKLDSSNQEMGTAIEKTRREISSYLTEIDEILSSLNPLPPTIANGQKEIEARLQKVEKEHTAVEQLQGKIEKEQAVVQVNLMQAVKKADQIQQKVQLIEEKHQTISLQAQAAEQNQKIVQEKIEKLLPKQNVKHPEKKVSFWAAISLKITEFASTFFALTLAALYKKEVDWQKWKNLIHPASSNGLNTSVGLIFLGGLSYILLRSWMVALSLTGVGLSLFYTQWRKLENGL